MAEAKQYAFKYREVVEALIKKQGLHEGLWSLLIRFGLTGANVGPSDDQRVPAAVVGVVEIGLTKVEKETNLTVDAAKVNPLQAPPVPPVRKRLGSR